MNKFGEKLQDLLNDTGLKQIQVAELSGVESGTISRYITGKRKPNISDIKKLSEHLGESAFNELATCYIKDLLTKMGITEEISISFGELKNFDKLPSRTKKAIESIINHIKPDDKLSCQLIEDVAGTIYRKDLLLSRNTVKGLNSAREQQKRIRGNVKKSSNSA